MFWVGFCLCAVFVFAYVLSLSLLMAWACFCFCPELVFAYVLSWPLLMCWACLCLYFRLVFANVLSLSLPMFWVGLCLCVGFVIWLCSEMAFAYVLSWYLLMFWVGYCLCSELVFAYHCADCKVVVLFLPFISPTRKEAAMTTLWATAMCLQVKKNHNGSKGHDQVIFISASCSDGLLSVGLSTQRWQDWWHQPYLWGGCAHRWWGFEGLLGRPSLEVAHGLCPRSNGNSVVVWGRSKPSRRSVLPRTVEAIGSNVVGLALATCTINQKPTNCINQGPPNTWHSLSSPCFTLSLPSPLSVNSLLLSLL